ncbi:TFIIH subunit TTDA/Tfb5 [Schizophyllum amplum]|uniref:General transcription and DNA repair factor IIH subunit TFB5 n=1 Tax=Schizophyllum amplum TaxID=97359 RepID=A0A550C832_9AGAR|nr:TFIIH subunit TTDA/Tfb5 [Auriculariopsis ampla]
MKAIKGVLLTCDPAVKQILLILNEKSNSSGGMKMWRGGFIIDDLDDWHIVIKADEEMRVRRELETELEKNTYTLES